MRAIAKFLTFITVVVLLAGGYLIWACELKVSPAGVVVESAADRPETFQSMYDASLVGSPNYIFFTQDPLVPDAAQYSLVTYTLKVRNLNALPAEWMQLDVEPKSGDVLIVKPSVEDAPAFNEQVVTVTLMTDRATSDYIRSATLSYYVYGHEYSLPLQLSRGE